MFFQYKKINKSMIPFLGIMLLLSGCTKQSEYNTKNMKAQLGPARHFDLPVPLSFKLVESSSKPQGESISDFLKYSGSLSINQTLAFFHHELEQNGWEINDLSSHREGFLFCTKPTKQCGIQIRPQEAAAREDKTALCLFITQK